MQERTLNRGFGVRVPGGAPVLTWGFTAPGHFLRVRFVPMFASCLLVSSDPAIRGLSNLARLAPGPGACPRIRAAVSGRRRPTPLDQWSRPSRRAPGARPEPPMPMPSRSVKTAAHAAFHCRADCARHGSLQRPVHVRVWGRRGVPGVTTTAADSARSDKSAGCSRLRPAPGMQGGRAARPSRRHVTWLHPGMRFVPGDRALRRRQDACSGYRPCRASWGEGGHGRAGCPGSVGFPERVMIAPARGLCAPATGGGRGVAGWAGCGRPAHLAGGCGSRTRVRAGLRLPRDLVM